MGFLAKLSGKDLKMALFNKAVFIKVFL